MSRPIGFVLGSTLPPALLPKAAGALEDSGFSTIWLSEDYFFTGGVAGAAIVLGSTETIAVGIGLLPTYTRHPALSAMEVGALAGAYPGRLTVGFGSGVKAWLEQVGIAQPAPLATMRATVDSVRRLLAGEKVESSGPFVLDGVRLAFPPDVPPEIFVGATGPKMMALAGELADGVLMSVMATPDFVRSARTAVDGSAPAGRRTKLTAFAIFALGDTVEEARAAARPVVAGYLALGPTQLTDAAGISEELSALLDAVGKDGFEAAMPGEWIDRLCVCGDAATCREAIDALIAAGADEVALMPVVEAADIVSHIVHAGSVLGLSRGD
ncbi:LLM class flavin-dependent oxidoreductase [Kribbella sp. NPDC050124]|uniref:LLM class flavin-dependent oxidoreductase n=1 Tax=Kribbella sp. NPDC050124 TaxID=3364114 RepID=UPI0037B35156